MNPPAIGDKYRVKRHAGIYPGVAEAEDALPNEFVVVGVRSAGIVGLIQSGSHVPSPIWWAAAAFAQDFERLPVGDPSPLAPRP